MVRWNTRILHRRLLLLPIIIIHNNKTLNDRKRNLSKQLQAQHQAVLLLPPPSFPSARFLLPSHHYYPLPPYPFDRTPPKTKCTRMVVLKWAMFGGNQEEFGGSDERAIQVSACREMLKKCTYILYFSFFFTTTSVFFFLSFYFFHLKTKSTDLTSNWNKQKAFCIVRGALYTILSNEMNTKLSGGKSCDKSSFLGWRSGVKAFAECTHYARICRNKNSRSLIWNGTISYLLSAFLLLLLFCTFSKV